MSHIGTTAFAAQTLPPILRGIRTRSVNVRGGTRMSYNVGVSRRLVIGIMTGTIASMVLPKEQAIAGEVVPYTDLPKGFKIMRPNGWNEFAGTPDQYDIKWADVIQPLEFVQILTTPSIKPLSELGDVNNVGERLAKSRGGELIDAKNLDIDGIPAYVFEIKKGGAHQLTLLTVNKAKLFSLTASSGENRWPKREKLLREVVASFRPKL